MSLGSRRLRRRRCIRGAIGTGNRTTTARGRGRRSRPRRSTRFSRAAASRERWVEMKKGTMIRIGCRERMSSWIRVAAAGQSYTRLGAAGTTPSAATSTRRSCVTRRGTSRASCLPCRPRTPPYEASTRPAASRPLRSTLEKTRIGPRALARIARGRAKPPGFSRRRRGSTRRTPRPHPLTGSQTPRIGSNATNGTSTLPPWSATSRSAATLPSAVRLAAARGARLTRMNTSRSSPPYYPSRHGTRSSPVHRSRRLCASAGTRTSRRFPCADSGEYF